MTAPAEARRSHRAHPRRRAGRARRARARAARRRGAAGAARPAPLLHVARDDRRLEAVASRPRVLRAEGARHPVSRLGHGALRPHRAQHRDRRAAHRGAGAAGARRRARSRPSSSPPSTPSCSACRRASSSAARSRHGARPAHRHGRADRGASTWRASRARGTVMEPGEYAVRGGILDLFRRAARRPVRLDFFGDTLEQIKAFDPETQRTGKLVQQLTLMPISEVAFGEAAEKLFRTRYVEQFGAVTGDDPLYEAVSAGQRYPGMEHWLPLFHEHLETLFDYVPGAPVSFDHLADEAVGEPPRADRATTTKRASKALESTELRRAALQAGAARAHVLLDAGVEQPLRRRPAVRYLTPFERARAAPTCASIARPRRAHLRRRAPAGRRQCLRRRRRPHAHACRARARRVIVAAWTPGARERLATLLAEHGFTRRARSRASPRRWPCPAATTRFAVLGLEQGFETPDLAVIGEQDILGDRLVRPRRKARRAADVITEATSLVRRRFRRARRPRHRPLRRAAPPSPRWARRTIACEIALRRRRQALPAGREHRAAVALRLRRRRRPARPARRRGLADAQGPPQAAPARDRLRADQDRRPAPAARGAGAGAAAGRLRRVRRPLPLRARPRTRPPASRPCWTTWPRASPMDRLVCGDVGFGKTEVALRAAFIAAMAGLQVAVVVPTTLLARQHFATFTERFKGLPVRIAPGLAPGRRQGPGRRSRPASRTAPSTSSSARTRCSARAIDFKRLGLLIVDEEQHFGVGHKERLKQLREDVHVLTLTATPIPRTLQLALSGVRELSLITTPPVDRLAVRTYISPFDPVIMREALRRERYRGGQSFYVVPRIADLDEVAEFLRRADARAEGRARPRPAGAERAGRRHDRLLRRQVRRAAVHRHRRIRPRHSQRQHADRAPRRHVRPGPALSAARPRRPLQGARLRLLHHAQRQAADRRRARSASRFCSRSTRWAPASRSPATTSTSAAPATCWARSSPATSARSASSCISRCWRRRSRRCKGGDIGEAQDQWSPQISLGTVGADPGQLRRRPAAPPRPLPAPVDAGDSARTSTRSPPSWSTASASCREEVKHLLDVMEIKALCRQAGMQQVDAGPKGAVDRLPQEPVRQPRGAGRLHADVARAA